MTGCSSVSALAAYRHDDDPAHRRLPSFVLDGFRHHYDGDGVRVIVPVEDGDPK